MSTDYTDTKYKIGGQGEEFDGTPDIKWQNVVKLNNGSYYAYGQSFNSIYELGQCNYIKQISNIDDIEAEKGAIIEHVGRTNENYKNGGIYERSVSEDDETIIIEEGDYYYCSSDNWDKYDLSFSFNSCPEELRVYKVNNSANKIDLIKWEVIEYYENSLGSANSEINYVRSNTFEGTICWMIGEGEYETLLNNELPGGTDYFGNESAKSRTIYDKPAFKLNVIDNDNIVIELYYSNKGNFVKYVLRRVMVAEKIETFMTKDGKIIARYDHGNTYNKYYYVDPSILTDNPELLGTRIDLSKDTVYEERPTTNYTYKLIPTELYYEDNKYNPSGIVKVPEGMSSSIVIGNDTPAWVRYYYR